MFYDKVDCQSFSRDVTHESGHTGLNYVLSIHDSIVVFSQLLQVRDVIKENHYQQCAPQI